MLDLRIYQAAQRRLKRSAFASGERRPATRRPSDTVRPATVAGMRVLVVGSGGVGSAFVAIASHREAYDHITVADIDIEQAEAAVDTAVNTDGGRIEAAHVDASRRGRGRPSWRGGAAPT